MHKSIPLETPIELINIEPMSFSPLISKCQIKVCYVSDEPNRNGSVITKEVASEMAPSLRGSPIVGYYNADKEDFEEHNRLLEIKGGKIKVLEITRPYGFIDLNADVWFQKFMDDDEVEREYLVTEGYLWTGQYPEANKVIEDGSPQSMELDNDHTKGFWTSLDKTSNKFFIINETIISKLCILGEDVEPCFEGANITSAQFSLDEDYKNTLFTFMKNIQEILSEGGKKKMYNLYNVEIGSTLWNLVYEYLIEKYPDEKYPYISAYNLEGIYEADNGKFFVCYKKTAPNVFMRFNFSYSEEDFSVEEPVECDKEFVPRETPQFDPEAVRLFVENYQLEKGKKEQSGLNKTEETIVEPEKIEYNLDEIPEFQEALERIEVLQNEATVKDSRIEALESELNTLKEFKLDVERKQKKELIDSFYMLSDEYKQDVLTNIDTYSLEDIEAKLAVICLRNKISFSKNDVEVPVTVTYTIEDKTDTTPDWIKAVISTNKELNNF